MPDPAGSRAVARVAFDRVRRHLPPRLGIVARLAGNGAVEMSGTGCRVTLSDGRTLLDFGSYAVTLLGHRPPAVVTAVARQLEQLPTSTRLLANPATAAAAAALVDYLGAGGAELRRVYFGSNGADAVEAAVKLARLATGRPRIVAAAGGFHGKSLGALALTHHDRFRAGLRAVLSPVTHVAPDDQDAVARELAAGDVAAVVFEPVQGENGVRVLDRGVLAAWSAAAAQYGAFVIADEIQTGLRRCGERSLALAAGLPVDAVLLGKPLAGGLLPLSAAVCTERLYAPLLEDPMVHTATFGGHPLACAALPAALAAIEELADRGPVLAAAMADGLARLRHDYPELVAGVRGQGLLWAVDLATPELADALVVRLARAGLLVSPCLGRPATVRLLPPLVAADADVAEALRIVAAELEPATATRVSGPALAAGG